MTDAATASAPASADAWDWLIFAVVYLGIAIGTIPFTRSSRAAIALLGAIAVVGIGRMTFQEATSHRVIDWATLALLFALMLLSASLRVAGFYTRVIQVILNHAHRPWTLLIGIVAASALLSAIFANDIICLAFTPVLAEALLRAGRRRPIPYLIALATSSNIGSAATLIGNPQNMVIGQSAHLAFGHFSLVVMPLVAICLVINVLAVALIYRKQLFTAPSPQIIHQQASINNSAEPVRPWHITKALLITAGLVIAFLFTPIPREITALVAAGLVLISRTQDPRKIFAPVDWDLILLFIGLFVVIGNVQRANLLAGTMDYLQSPTGMHLNLYHPATFSAVTLVLSNLVSNVPAVLLLRPGLAALTARPETVTHMWYLLAVISTFAGNLTLLGSIANLIVAEQAKAHGIILGFREYLKVGLPLTLIVTAIAVGYFLMLA